MNDIAVIHLTNGGFTVVDADRFEALSQHRWQRTPEGYAARTQGRRKIYLHRVVNKTPPGLETDHVDPRFKLDNRQMNLRTATPGQNKQNRLKKKWRGRARSIYKGVYWSTQRQKWIAQIDIERRTKNLGGFISEQEAALAYNEAALKYYGEFAKLNEV